LSHPAAREPAAATEPLAAAVSAPVASPPADELRRQVDLLIRQVGHWGPARWGIAAQRGGASRADLVYSLVQRLADLGAPAGLGGRRPVPRLDNDLALPDQVRVVAADLAAHGGDPAVLAAAAAVAATRAAL
jgi:hypothetical protein